MAKTSDKIAKGVSDVKIIHMLHEPPHDMKLVINVLNKLGIAITGTPLEEELKDPNSHTYQRLANINADLYYKEKVVEEIKIMNAHRAQEKREALAVKKNLEESQKDEEQKRNETERLQRAEQEKERALLDQMKLQLLQADKVKTEQLLATIRERMNELRPQIDAVRKQITEKENQIAQRQEQINNSRSELAGLEREHADLVAEEQILVRNLQEAPVRHHREIQEIIYKQAEDDIIDLYTLVNGHPPQLDDDKQNKSDPAVEQKDKVEPSDRIILDRVANIAAAEQHEREEEVKQAAEAGKDQKKKSSKDAASDIIAAHAENLQQIPRRQKFLNENFERIVGKSRAEAGYEAVGRDERLDFSKVIMHVGKLGANRILVADVKADKDIDKDTKKAMLQKTESSDDKLDEKLNAKTKGQGDEVKKVKEVIADKRDAQKLIQTSMTKVQERMSNLTLENEKDLTELRALQGELVGLEKEMKELQNAEKRALNRLDEIAAEERLARGEVAAPSPDVAVPKLQSIDAKTEELAAREEVKHTGDKPEVATPAVVVISAKPQPIGANAEELAREEVKHTREKPEVVTSAAVVASAKPQNVDAKTEELAAKEEVKHTEEKPKEEEDVFSQWDAIDEESKSSESPSVEPEKPDSTPQRGPGFH